YNGSSNTYPLYGIELNRQTAKPIGYRRELFLLEPWRYGWQRFGEHNDNTFLDPFIEGAWMTKHNGKYYLQYGAPGTEFSGYADGVAVGNSPLGFFNNQSDPLSMKLGGFNRGAGHGATFLDNFNNYWHVSSTVVCVKNTFERRLGIWPAGFDKDDKMFCNTAYGDYPHYVPESNQNQWTRSNFTHWMLLNYQKPIEVSSVYQNFLPNFVNDENIKTYWSAASANNNEWLISDLLQPATIEAIQINYSDQNVADDHLGKINGQFHQYKIFTSNDKLSWTLLIDKSKNDKDVPHDYIDLEQPVIARYIKLQNLHMPTGKFAISGFRIFGNGNGSKPDTVKDFVVLRTNKDKRSAYIKWQPVDNAQGYIIYYGTAPDKLYQSIMIYSDNEFWFTSMDSQKTYYFTIDTFNENGIHRKNEIKKVE
ncbi:MAG: discoidin domain-containing protein, partial [Sediminibacterium sp.]|nr:discoidin domain-containing protein [Sediminibacterium sp.]